MQMPSKLLLMFGAVVFAAVMFWIRRPAEIPATNNPTASTLDAVKVAKSEHSAIRTTRDSAQPSNALRNEFELASASAQKALNGDGKAALAVASALEKCLPIKYQYRDSADPKAAFESEVGSRNLPQWIIDRMRAKFDACDGFIKGDPFASLPRRPNGYESTRYWADLAYRENDPVALTQHAAAQKGLVTGVADSSSIESAQADINKSAVTGDPEALFRIGSLIADARVGQNTLNGFATMIAACNMGYDCTTKNEFAFGACAAANACPPGEIYTDKIRTTVGDVDYAKAFGLAQQLQDALARGDAKTVLQFVQLKGAQSIASR
jgi:hypothetical protein